MSRLFISHSSRNNAEALALQAWLGKHGWPKREVFLDIDPEDGLVAGQRWVSELLKAAGRCEAVICAISPEWLASTYCRVELNQAMSKGKAVFGVIVRPVSIPEINDKLPELTSNYQLVDLSAPGETEAIQVSLPPDGRPETVRFRRDGLVRLRTGLMKAGIDARSFAFDAGRETIFPGLRALEEQDAAIYFGRDGKLVEGLDALRRSVLRDRSHVFCIVGASGAGKSSFLRAGLYPRLERDDRHWLPLRALRPAREILSNPQGLLASLENRFGVLGADRPRGNLKQQLQQPGGFAAVINELRLLAHRRLLDEGAPLPTVVLPIDQGEELFDAQQAEGRAFLDMVARVTTAPAPVDQPPALVVLVTIRSDNFEKLQKDAILSPPPGAIFSLPPMAAGAFKDVIEGPVHRWNAVKERPLYLDPRLVDQLLHDVGGESPDALPLLAFVLESLFTEFSKSGALTLANYEASGRLQGAIELAVKKAFDHEAPGVPADAKQREALLQRAFIPWLARIDEASGEFKGNVARWEDIPAESRPLIEKLIEVRLLRSTQPTGKDGRPDPGQSRTVEPAHEALLRLWDDLRKWLKQEQANLVMLETILRAAKEWQESGRSPDYISHRGGRLQDADKLARREDYSASFNGEARAYLDAARKVGQDQQPAERRTRSKGRRPPLSRGARLTWLVLGLSVLGIVNAPAVSKYWAQLPGVHLDTRLPGEEFRDCDDCPEMVVVPAGSFVMGSPAGEEGRSSDEGPQRTVTISRAFSAGKFEVTFAEWDACVAGGGCNGYRPGDEGWGRGNRPVINVSWNDAQAYVQWLSNRTGKRYRLLSEAEWEYVARAGTTTAFSFGNNITPAQAKFNSDRTAPVGSFPANRFGLHDMHGNVWEWTEDCNNESYAGAPSDGSAWRSGDCSRRVLRGGSWYDFPRKLRSANRFWNDPTDRIVNFGFRVARTL